MYDLGIIGGMGPLATVEFFKRIVNYTEAGSDQEHLNICILNKTCIPDRVDYILNPTRISPLPFLNKSFHELSELGARVVAIPCNTSHFFVDSFFIPENLRFINMVSEAINVMRDYFPYNSICVVGTTGTKLCGVYDTYANQIPEIKRLIYPQQQMQKEIMEIIYKIKAGVDFEKNKINLSCIFDKIMKENSKIVFLIACTELSLYSEELSKLFTVIDSLDILAIKCVEACGFKVKEELIPIVIRDAD